MYSSSAHFLSQHLLVTFGYQNPNNHSKKQLPMLQQSLLVFDFPLLLHAALFSSSQTNVATVATLW